MPDQKFVSDAYLLKCCQIYMERSWKRYGFRWGIQDWMVPLLPIIYEAYKASYERLSPWLSGERLFLPCLRASYGPRIDVKIYGTENSDLELGDVSDKAKVTTPEWLYKVRQPGTGYVIEPHRGQIEITLEFICKTDGEFTAALRGADVRGSDGKRIPKWVTYTGLTLNGETVFEGEQRVWHDQPYRYTKTVEAGDAVTLELRWNPS